MGKSVPGSSSIYEKLTEFHNIHENGNEMKILFLLRYKLSLKLELTSFLGKINENGKSLSKPILKT